MRVRFRGFPASGTTSNTQPKKKMHLRMGLGLGGFEEVLRFEGCGLFRV